jgi:hypothetical protein
MADAVDERNSASTERLAAIGTRLSEAELATEIDVPWTAAGLFAHIAFWDRFVMERWKLAAERGGRTPAGADFMDRINDASLDQWMAIPPSAAVELCVAAARDVDAFVVGIPGDVRAEIAAEGRPRLLDRSLHRGEHLVTLEAAFPAG